MRRTNALGRFLRSNSGNVAMMFGLIVIPLLIAAGMALDFLRANDARTRLAEAADAGVLAAARARLVTKGMTDAKATEIARKYFDANAKIGSDLKVDDFDFTFDEEAGTFTLAVKGALNTTLLGVTGKKSMALNILSEARVAPPGILEAVLVLDNTNSMDGAKMTALKESATDLVESIMADTDNTVKVGIVPFADYVNVGISRRNESWITVPADYEETEWDCDTEYPNAVKSNCRTVSGTCNNDGVSYSCSWEECDWDYGDPVEECEWETDSYVWRGCVGSRNHPLNIKDEDYSSTRVPGILDEWCTEEILPMTTDKAAVKSKINDLYVTGNTYIPAGLFWGQALISSDEPFTQALPQSEIEANAGLKALILMTDGANTLSPDYPKHDDDDVSLANDLTRELCEEIKAKKIFVHTIAFEVTNADIQDLLKDCASDPSNYYDADNAAELSAAFESIGDDLKRLALSK